MQRFILLTLTLFVFTAIPSLAHANIVVGKVQDVTGEVLLRHAAKSQLIEIEPGMDIELGDTIMTTQDGLVKIVFLDNSTLSLNGDDGELVIDQYVYDPANPADGTARFTILRASFEFIGGLLDKGEKEAVQIQMDFGSIGVRGTKVLRSMRKNQCWVYLEEGNIRVFNDKGEVFLAAGEGTHIMKRNEAPMPAEPWSQEDIDWVKGAVSVE